jgi:DNA modification methylase
MKKITEKLNLGHEKTCQCSLNHLNCMTPKEWIKSQIGVWQFAYEGRDVRDKAVHPAVFPIGLAKRVIELFTHKGELVLDPFVGIGTTLVAARDLGRNAVGFDLNPQYIKVAKDRLVRLALDGGTQQEAIVDDARNIDQYLEPETVKLVFTSPPYANLLNRPRLNKSRRGDLRKNSQFLRVEQYSQDSRDLGTLTVEDYTQAMTDIYQRILPLMRPKAHNVINVPDMWSQANKYGTRVPLHVHMLKAMLATGFELRNIIIWDRTNIVNRVGIFGWPSNYITMGTTFEYLLDFWKPPTTT